MIYNYTKQANLDNLELEIKSSSITIALDTITLTGTDGLEITFKAALSTSEESELDTIVTNHDHTLPSPNDPNLVDFPVGKVVATESLPFTNPSGFRFRGTSFSGTVSGESTADLDYEITQERWINGGRLLVSAIGPEDKITFQVVDKNNVLGLGANVVLDEFIKDYFVPDEGNLEVRLDYPARIIAGLFLRLKYTNSNTSTITVKCNLYLHWKAA
jgi:hypothetical protein